MMMMIGHLGRRGLQTAAIQHDWPYATHQVFNLPSEPLGDYNAFDRDPILASALARFSPASQRSQETEHLRRFGQLVGSRQYLELGEEANLNPPELQAFDRYGRRIEHVRFHPAYHELMKAAKEHHVHSYCWPESGLPQHGSLVARSALLYLLNQGDASHSCPITMTFAGVPSLRLLNDAALRDTWLQKVCAGDYDPRDIHVSEKRSATLGMALTEKQGGSDVRANTTRATRDSNNSDGDGGTWTIVGHKFFFSAPMSDGFLTLAYTDAGLSCFLVPRWLAPGVRNTGLQLQRLKQKLGNWANASSEVEYRGAKAFLVGEEGRGIAAIMEMVAHTRLDCALGSAGQMRMAAAQALYHCQRRSAFGKLLVDQPLMRNTLADLCLESQAATALALLVADSFSSDADLARVVTPVAKFFICKRAPVLVAEAMECLGGPGFIDDHGNMMPRLFRDSPLNSIWEGCGNIQALDIFRALSSPKTRSAQALAGLLNRPRGTLPAYDALVDALSSNLAAITKALASDPSAQLRLQFDARTLTTQLALATQAAALFTLDPALFPFFCENRFAVQSASQLTTFGTLAHSSAATGKDNSALFDHLLEAFSARPPTQDRVQE